MSVNKDIIIRGVVGFIFFIIFIKVVGPVIYETLKGKLPGASQPDNDIDSMIRRQKERLRAQYGLVGRDNESYSSSPVENEEKTTPPPTKEIEAIYKESRWGGGEFGKNIQNEIAKNYSYTLADTKINSFIMLAEKRHYLRYLSAENQKSPEAIKNYLSLVMLNLILIEEIRNREFNVLDRVAKKCHVSSLEFMLALQLKVLYAINTKKEIIKEERLFTDSPALHQYSEETIKEAVITILKKEANLWAKGHSLYFEEMSLHLSYADILVPLPKTEHKKDINTAYAILKVDEDTEIEDIKKAYKKIAMLKHPDKIGQMKLPRILEKRAMGSFNQIQEAYDIIMTHRKK